MRNELKRKQNLKIFAMSPGTIDRQRDIQGSDQDFCPKNMLLKLQRAKVCLLVTILSLQTNT